MVYLAIIWAFLTFILGVYNESKIKKLEKRIEELEKNKPNEIFLHT